MERGAVKNRSVEPITLDEWAAEVAKHQAIVVTDPGAATTAQLVAKMNRSPAWVQRYLKSEMERGLVERVWKVVGGRRVPAYKRVKV